MFVHIPPVSLDWADFVEDNVAYDQNFQCADGADEAMSNERTFTKSQTQITNLKILSRKGE
eukprot:2994495-Amphidinium_carterae.1